MLWSRLQPDQTYFPSCLMLYNIDWNWSTPVEKCILHYFRNRRHQSKAFGLPCVLILQPTVIFRFRVWRKKYVSEHQKHSGTLLLDIRRHSKANHKAISNKQSIAELVSSEQSAFFADSSPRSGYRSYYLNLPYCFLIWTAKDMAASGLTWFITQYPLPL